MQFVPRNNLKYEGEMSSTMSENQFGLKFSALCICGICQLLHSSLEGRQTSIIPACQLLSTKLNFFSGFSPLAHINLEYINVRTLAVISFFRGRQKLFHLKYML